MMSSFTSRLGLRKPDLTDVVNVQTDVNNNFLAIDNAVNLFPCTISSRPATPYVGKLILLIDLQKIQVWTGSGWEDVGVSASPGIAGRVGFATLTADTALQTSGSGETGPHMSITFTADSAKRYWIEYLVGAATDGTGGSRVDIRGRLRRAAGASVTTAGTLIGTESFLFAMRGTNGAIFYKRTYEIGPGVSGQTTVGLFTIVAGSGSARLRATNTEYNGLMYIREMALS